MYATIAPLAIGPAQQASLISKGCGLVDNGANRQECILLLKPWTFSATRRPTAARVTLTSYG